MSETEENKASEQSEANESKVDSASGSEPKSEQSADKPEAAPKSDAAMTDPASADAVKADAVKKESAKEEVTPAVEAKEDKKEAKPAKAEPARTKQPTPEDKLNINEDLPWYVVQAFSGYEASVKRSLIERIERAGLGADFGEILVPTEEVVEIRGGQKRKSERKFFPGYVLVQINLTDESWHLVKDVPRVLRFIGGTADRPAPITA